MMLAALCLWGSSSPRAWAHPISITQADAYLAPDKLRVAVDLFVEDLVLFHGLESDDENYFSEAVLREAMEKHKALLLERLQVRDAEGNLLKGSVVKIDECDFGKKGVPALELMAHSLVYHLEYTGLNRPEFLTVSQQLGTNAMGLPAVMMFRLKQEGGETPFVVELANGEPVTVPIDWDNPPLSEDASEAEWDAWDKKRKEKMLGITSYSMVYSFLYIEDFEVRHEVLVPLLSLEASVPIPRADPNFLEVDEQEAARKAIAGLFQKSNPTTINGDLIEPRVERIDFYGVDFKDFAKPSAPRRVSMLNARAGVILSYVPTRSPRSLHVEWNLFNRYIPGVQAVVIAGEATHQQLFSPYQRTYQWTSQDRPRSLTLEEIPIPIDRLHRTYWWISYPLAGLFLSGVFYLVAARTGFARASALFGFVLGTASLFVADRAGAFDRFRYRALSEHEADAVFDALHKNIYRAFEYRKESDIYDTLAESANGPLLENLYLSLRRGLIMQEQGGAVSRVEKVTLIEGMRFATRGKDPRGFDYDATWEVTGTVEHWGHIHTRTNRYRARFAVQPADRAWRIADVQMMDQEQLSVRTRLRSMSPSS